jgi:hypothetical protein
MYYDPVQAILFGLRLSRSVKHFDDHTCGIVMQAIDEQGVERPTRNVSNSDVFNDWLPMPVPMLADYSRYDRKRLSVRHMDRPGCSLAPVLSA